MTGSNDRRNQRKIFNLMMKTIQNAHKNSAIPGLLQPQRFKFELWFEQHQRKLDGTEATTKRKYKALSRQIGFKRNMYYNTSMH